MTEERSAESLLDERAEQEVALKSLSGPNNVVNVQQQVATTVVKDNDVPNRISFPDTSTITNYSKSIACDLMIMPTALYNGNYTYVQVKLKILI
jgi:hypothetical protein